MPSTYLRRSSNSTTGNRRKFTFSAWLKLSTTSTTYVFEAGGDGNNNFALSFQNDNKFYIKSFSGGSTGFDIATSAKYRDFSGWYHFVVAIDTEQSTASNRAKIYVNGEIITSFADEVYCSQNTDLQVSHSVSHNIGASSTDSQTFNGSMSHIHFCDGYQYQASDFGSTDSTTGEWKINTSPSVSYGTTGFTILKDGNTITDQSSNSNNFEVRAGTLTKTEDCPSNVFATGNPLMVKIGTWSNGNNSIVGSSSNGVRPQMWSTLGAKTGKFYAEAKYTDKSGGMVGVSDYSGTMEMIRGGWYQGYASNSVGFWNSGQKYIANATTNYGNAWSNNDIIQIAMDLDNMCVYFGINGTWQNSGNPASGASKTGGITIPNTRNEDYFMSWGDGSVSQSATCHVNYGNGYFGTTAVSSAGTNASGNGIFEYDVPTGYTALSTKGLNL